MLADIPCSRPSGCFSPRSSFLRTVRQALCCTVTRLLTSNIRSVSSFACCFGDDSCGGWLDDVVQCSLLGDLYEATGGRDGAWTNATGWAQAAAGNPADFCGFYGVACNSNGLIKEMCGALIFSLAWLLTLTPNSSLENNALYGTIPESLGSLSTLESIILANNGLFGTLSPSLGSLSLLTFFDVLRNNLEGELPATLGSLTNLWLFDISYNGFVGSVPSWLGGHLKLRNIAMLNNNLTGKIPDQLSRLSTTLEVLYLVRAPLSPD